eukprot:scaffold3323_cov279-Pinguiococcus_pyrenoidosus.AAC.7
MGSQRRREDTAASSAEECGECAAAAVENARSTGPWRSAGLRGARREESSRILWLCDAPVVDPALARKPSGGISSCAASVRGGPRGASDPDLSVATSRTRHAATPRAVRLQRCPRVRWRMGPIQRVCCPCLICRRLRQRRRVSACPVPGLDVGLQCLRLIHAGPSCRVP